MYLCLASVDEAFCGIGASIELRECGYGQDIEGGEWISKQTQFEYDENVDMIRVIGCDDAEHQDLCLGVSARSKDGNKVTLEVTDCDDATVFKERHFFP